MSPRKTRADETLEIDARELSGLFATPGWLRGLGLTAWLLVGVTFFSWGRYGFCRSRTPSSCR